jgi:hypothetical protein
MIFYSNSSIVISILKCVVMPCTRLNVSRTCLYLMNHISGLVYIAALSLYVRSILELAEVLL